MGKTNELDHSISGLREAAQALTAAADSLSALFGADQESPKAQPAESAPKSVTLEAVRAVLAEKSRKGHTAEVRELLLKHGAAKLSEINPSEFETLLSEAGAIGIGEG